jgi:hypothetical protein
MRKAALWTVLLIVVATTGLWSINDNAGTTGFNFMKFNYSPRAAALAGAYTGMPGDAEAAFFNPAGLRALPNSQVASSYMSYLEGFQGGSAVYALHRSNDLGLAVFTQFLTSPDIDRTTVNEQGEYMGVDGTFTSSDLLFGVGGGYRINPVLDAGAALKFIHESIDGSSGSAMAMDLSIEHQTTYQFLKLGVALRNLGFQTGYFSESKYKEGLPVTATVGFYYYPMNRLNALLDIYRPFKGDFAGKLGVEYRVHPRLDLRLGYKSNSGDWQTGGDMSAFAGLTTGFGINWRNCKFDYSVSSYGDLGLVNQLALQYQFK